MSIQSSSVRSRVTNKGTFVVKVFPRRIQGRACIKCLKDSVKSVHHIVPVIYIQPIPRGIEIAHNTVNMCYDCHHEYEYDIAENANKYRAELAERYIPDSPDYFLSDGTLMRSCYQRLHRAKTCALPMYKHRDVLPEAKRIEFDDTLRDFFGGAYTDEDLWKLMNKTEAYPVKAGEMVVRQLKERQQLMDFCAAWKAHFLAGVGLSEGEIIERGRLKKK